MQLEGDVDPFTLLLVPAGQAVHNGFVPPAEVLYEPTGQLEQMEDLANAAKVPASHWVHVEAAVAPSTADAVPGPHEMHCPTDTEPVVCKYVPAGHLVH